MSPALRIIENVFDGNRNFAYSFLSYTTCEGTASRSERNNEGTFLAIHRKVRPSQSGKVLGISAEVGQVRSGDEDATPGYVGGALAVASAAVPISAF